jgi:polyisoprenoid-binding protein YceI
VQKLLPAILCLGAAAWAATPAATHGGLRAGGLDLGYRQLYNFEFTAAHQTFQRFIAAHPADPLGPASEAVADLFDDMNRLQILQAQFFTRKSMFQGKAGPGDPAFEAALARAQALAAKAPPNDVNALYTEALCHGLRADYLGVVQKHYLASLGQMKAGQAVAQKLLALDPNYADAYLAIGMENYVLGQQPAPVRWLLKLDGAMTNQNQGIAELRKTAAHGHYLRTYARILLALAAVHAHNPVQARQLLEPLVAKFPHCALYAEALERLDIQARLDPQQTQIHFTLGALLHTVHGTFALAPGADANLIAVDPANGAATGRVTVAAASGQSGDQARDREMRTKVLDVRQYPHIVFQPTQLTGTLARQGISRVTLRGTMRLVGGEHPFALPLTVSIHGSHFTARGTATVPYVAWGLHNPSNFLLRVHKTVTLTIEAAGTIVWPAMK